MGQQDIGMFGHNIAKLFCKIVAMTSRRDESPVNANLQSKVVVNHSAINRLHRCKANKKIVAPDLFL